MVGIFLVIIVSCAVTQAQDENVQTEVESPLYIPNISRRIVNGQSAYLGQFPYQAYLLLNSEKESFTCGGSIISNSWILTAAHWFVIYKFIKSSIKLIMLLSSV